MLLCQCRPLLYPNKSYIRHKTGKKVGDLFGVEGFVRGGLEPEMIEYSNNDVPYGIQYTLSYAGLVPLRSQNVFYNRQTANFIFEAKQLNQFAKNVLMSREDTEYVFEWTSGTTVQIANYSNAKLVCRSGKFYSAATPHPKLGGRSMDLNCDSFSNGILKGKNKYTILQQYGLALRLEHQSSADKEIYTIASVDIL